MGAKGVITLEIGVRGDSVWPSVIALLPGSRKNDPLKRTRSPECQSEKFPEGTIFERKLNQTPVALFVEIVYQLQSPFDILAA
jgi:hypothetical protein